MQAISARVGSAQAGSTQTGSTLGGISKGGAWDAAVLQNRFADKNFHAADIVEQLRSQTKENGAVESGVGNVVAGGGHEKTDDGSDVKKAFQEFVAGTFYQQMLKTLRKMTSEPAYLNGGQAEKMFQSQMDQEVAQQLAGQQGAAFSDQLFDTFSAQLRGRSIVHKS